MGIKIGINGFGRIGRVVMRILAEDPEKFEVCGINLRKADIDYMVYLLKYDSVFPQLPRHDRARRRRSGGQWPQDQGIQRV